MFAAELLKVRSMPAPRLTLIITLAVVVISAAVVVAIAPDGSASTAYYEVPGLVAQVIISIGAIVLGAWMFGLEFASKTLRLAATVQPSRPRLVLAKFLSAVLLVSAYVIAVMAITLLLEGILASVGSVTFPFSQQLDNALSAGVEALLWGVFAFGLALLFRSYTAGLVAALVLALGVDAGLQQIPTVGKYSLGSATSSIGDAITGDAATLALGIAVLAVAAWLAVVIGAGAARFITRDLK
jgi:ABC-type transport system involved in multi-copper enzyme maturation permease subunit